MDKPMDNDRAKRIRQRRLDQLEGTRKGLANLMAKYALDGRESLLKRVARQYERVRTLEEKQREHLRALRTVSPFEKV